MCINPHQTGFAGKGSDRLQVIKFWPSCDGAKMFGFALLQTACSVCISLSVFFINLIIITTAIIISLSVL